MKSIRKIKGKTYIHTGNYSWTKKAAKKRIAKAKKSGLNVKVFKSKTSVKKKVGYPIFLEARKTKKGYVPIVKK